MADRLASARRRDFVGRQVEVARFSGLLEASEGAVVFVQGPGGVGKTTLLGQFEVLARERGRVVVRLDGRDVAPIPSAFLAETARSLEVEGDPIAGLADVDGLVLLVDTVELLTALDRWWREDLLPQLAGGTVVVLAGRDGPSLGWRTDPGWRDLMHSIRLGNLDAADARAFLLARGLSEASADRALAFTRGHPLALALVADVAAGGGREPAPAGDPEVVATLLGHLVDSVPSAQHRAALEASALVLSTTEPLLEALLSGVDVHEVFTWLRGLSIMQTGPRGLFPHDLARDVLAADLRWRRPERYAALHGAGGAYYRDLFYSVETGRQQQVLVDYVFLHRDNPVLGPLVTGSAGGAIDLRSLVTTPATSSDRARATAMVHQHEGAESARWFSFWWDRQPEATLLVRAPDGEVLGLVTTLSLDEIPDADRHRDPAVSLAVTHLDSLAPLQPGERASFFRFWLTADGYQDQGPVQLFITLQFVRFYLATRRLAVSFVSYADPEVWAPVCAYADVHPVPGSGYLIGDHRYGLFFHDWRVRPPLEWLELLGEREVSAAPLEVERDVAASQVATVVRLSDEAFAEGVRRALKSLGRADALRDSVLLTTPVVLARSGPGADLPRRAAVLRDLIRDAAARMEASPRDRRAFRALHHTYLQPAATQAEAARLLDLPMTTYRRHLAAGIERLTQLLRQEDLDVG